MSPHRSVTNPKYPSAAPSSGNFSSRPPSIAAATNRRRNRLIADGSGGEAYRGDAAISGDKIAAVGEVEGRADRLIDANGQLATPGFVDIHTHLDAQITWDPIGSSSCRHGVTSVVMGNRGFTFAPCKPEDREYLAHLMESVEDVPAKTVLAGKVLRSG